MNEREDDFLEWHKGRATKHVRKPQRERRDDNRLNIGGPRARLRAASGTPESIVKVISFGKEKKSVRQLIDYISRKGELEIETKDGSLLRGRVGPAGTMELVEGWSVHFRELKNARNAMHIQVSAPPGTDRDAFTRAARVFAGRAFGDGYDYALARHDDAAHPHVHIVVVRDGTAGDYLRNSKSELQVYREIMAEAAGEQGIVMNATPRFVRGVPEKGEKMAVRKAREREGTSLVDQRAAAEVLEEVRGRAVPERPWISAMAERAAQERAGYEELAQSFEEIGAKLGEDENGLMRSTGRLVRRQSMALRQVMTRRDQMHRIVGRDRLDRRTDQAKAAKVLARAYRDELAKSRAREKRIAPASEVNMQRKLARFDQEYGDRIDELVRAGITEAERLRKRLDLTRARQADRDRDFER